MPRIYTSANNPLDFCNAHFPTETEACKRYGDLGDGPDNRGNCFGWDAEHPEYDGAGYACEACGIILTSANAELADRYSAAARKREADHIDGYDRDDLGESPDY